MSGFAIDGDSLSVWTNGPRIFALSDSAFRMLIVVSVEFADREDQYVNKYSLRSATGAGLARWSEKRLKRATRELVDAGLWIPEKRFHAGWNVSPGIAAMRAPRRGSRWDTTAYPDVFSRDGGACRYCGAREHLQVDHVIPRIQGGTDHATNLVVACRACNAGKGGRTPAQAGMRLLEVPT